MQDCDPSHYPIEFVNSCTLSGVPDHTVILKPGAPYIIIHNTSPALCNGTRVIYHRRVGKCLEVEIVSGVRKGEFHFLPRLVLTTKDVSLPFTLKRIQYPLQSCFAMSVFRCARTSCFACALMNHTDVVLQDGAQEPRANIGPCGHILCQRYLGAWIALRRCITSTPVL